MFIIMYFKPAVDLPGRRERSCFTNIWDALTWSTTHSQRPAPSPHEITHRPCRGLFFVFCYSWIMATTPPAAPIDAIDDEERDTEASENLDSQAFMELLLPYGEVALPLHFTRFGLSYNAPAFRGWVKQPSPSCAAASVAGAWNALNEFDRSDARAIDLYGVLRFYEGVIESRIDKKRASIERVLGGCSLQPLTAQVEHALQEQGKCFGGKGEASIKRKVLMSILHTLLSDTSLTEPVFVELRTVADMDADISQDQEDTDTAHEINDEEEEKLKSCIATWDWKSNLYDFYHNMDGLAKLRRPKPSTALLGNWALLLAARTMEFEREQSIQLNGQYLLGKKVKNVKIQIPISSNDAPSVIDKQWAELWSTFTRPESIIVYHLKNHYALIFAMREYQKDPHGPLIREVLTARKGQRPSTWISFAEVRNTVLKWNGYRMVHIRAERLKQEDLESNRIGCE